MSGRIRSLKPELTRDRSLARVPPEVRWTFAALLCFVDDEGYCEDDARLIKADVYPYDDITADDVNKHLGMLAVDAELVCRFAVNGVSYLHIPRFRDDGLASQDRTAWGQRPQKAQRSRHPTCEIEHGNPGEAALFGRNWGGTRPVRDQSATATGKTLPQGPGTKDQGPYTKDQSTTPSSAVIRAGFARFWEVYPRKVAKQAAETAFAKAARETPVAELIAAAIRYRDNPSRKPDYTCHPTTWLNQGRWADEDRVTPPPRDDGDELPEAWR